MRGGQAGSPSARLRSLPHLVVFGRPQCRHPRACSLSAPAGHRLPGFPGGPSCAARKQRRRRGESGRDASRPAPTERAYVRVSERATLSPVPPAGGSLRAFGTPGLLFRTRGCARSERDKRPSPRAAGSAAGRTGRHGADGELARTEKSCSEGRRRWVVGGGGGWGRRSPSYLSKVESTRRRS